MLVLDLARQGKMWRGQMLEEKLTASVRVYSGAAGQGTGPVEALKSESRSAATRWQCISRAYVKLLREQGLRVPAALQTRTQWVRRARRWSP